MKGIELLSSIVALLMMLGIGSLFGGAIIFVLNAAMQPTSSKINYEMYLSPIYPPIKYESMMLSYLESTEKVSGIQYKKILAYAAYQNNITDIFIDGNKEVKTLESSTFDIFSYWLEREGYILALSVDGKAYVIAKNTRALPNLPTQKFKIRRISVPIYVDADMIKHAKTASGRENPLNVTLDFYVR
jgi:hypothetical protein